jgi:hypothetical protein
MLTRSSGLFIAIMIGTVGCVQPGSSSQPAGTSQAPATSASSAPTEPILGTWRMENTCEALVRAYARYRVTDQLGPALATLGVDSNTTGQPAAKMCDGAKQFQHTLNLQPNGYLIDHKGKAIQDDCHCYLLVDNHTSSCSATRETPTSASDMRSTVTHRRSIQRCPTDARRRDTAASLRSLSTSTHWVLGSA